VAGGTDRKNPSYDVLLASRGHDCCDCKGHERYSACKHVAALRSLVAEGAFDACPECGDAGYVPTSALSAIPCPACQPAPTPAVAAAA
jgi:hypothetical protein